MSPSLFQQAFDEVEPDVKDIAEETEFARWNVLERLRVPDRVIAFAVRWTDDAGAVRVNQAWRVQHCNVLGPYKGGLRFDPAVAEDTLRFLAFEQCLKNALTGLPMGGGKGGADFNIKKASPTEIMRFCQAFMDEYVRYGGEDVDVPAGDIGVSSREVGFLFGRVLQPTGRHTGSITGKPAELGGIAGRTEATGYGCVKFVALALEEMGEKLEGQRVTISGSGNVAQYAAERAIREGAKVISLSGRDGTMIFESGLTQEGLDALREGKERGKDLGDLVGRAKGASFKKDATPWGLECDVALPCATQNELDKHDAETLANNGVKIVAEGANMPCTADATHCFRDKKIAHASGKAANAGGVAVSGLELSQNAHRMPRTREQTLGALDEIMTDIHNACVREGRDRSGWVNYPRGANRAGFRRLARGLAAIGVY